MQKMQLYCSWKSHCSFNRLGKTSVKTLGFQLLFSATSIAIHLYCLETWDRELASTRQDNWGFNVLCQQVPYFTYLEHLYLYLRCLTFRRRQSHHLRTRCVSLPVAGPSSSTCTRIYASSYHLRYMSFLDEAWKWYGDICTQTCLCTSFFWQT